MMYVWRVPQQFLEANLGGMRPYTSTSTSVSGAVSPSKFFTFFEAARQLMVVPHQQRINRCSPVLWIISDLATCTPSQACVNDDVISQHLPPGFPF